MSRVLVGLKGTPKTSATIDFGFGDTLEVPAPDFSQLGLQGYAPMTCKYENEDVNDQNLMHERIDAMQGWLSNV